MIMDKEKLLETRNSIKKKKPDFTRKDSNKKKRLGTRWVRPKGLHNKLRLGRKGHRNVVSTGYGSPKAVRGLHSSGLEAVIVSNKELDKIDPKNQGIVISGTVGMRKKAEIVKEAQSRGIKILNLKDSTSFLKKVDDAIKSRKDTRDRKKKKKEEGEKKRKAEAEKKKEEGKGIEKAVSDEERIEQEKTKKDEEKKEKDKVLTMKK